MNPFSHTGLSISDSLKSVRKSVLIYETIILEHAIHNKNLLEQRKKLVERKERSHRLIVKGAEFEKAFPLSRDLEQEEVQEVMDQLKNSSYNKSIVRQGYMAALHKEQQQIAEAVEKAERGDDG